MTISDRKALRTSAREALCLRSGQKRLFAIHICAISLVSLILSVISYLLDQRLVGASGIDGIASRSLLQTIQLMLNLLYSIASPFWNMGLFFVALQVFRHRFCQPSDLAEGFRQLGPILRLILLKMLLIILFSLASSLVCSTLISLLSYTPLGKDMMAFLETVPSSSYADMMALMEDPEIMEKLLNAVLPLLPIGMVVTAAVAIPLFYRLRLLDFAMMDAPKDGPWSALRTSFRLTKGNCKALFALDLSFWWYYLLLGLLAALSVVYVYIPLPLDPTVWFWAYTGVYIIGQIALHSAADPLVKTTYAAAYDLLKAQTAPAEPAET